MKRRVLILFLCLGFAAVASADPFTIYKGTVDPQTASAFWVGFAPQPEPPLPATLIEIGASGGVANFWVKFAPQPEPPTFAILSSGTEIHLWVGATWGVGPSPFMFLLLDGFGSGNVLLNHQITPCVVGSGAVCPSDSWLFSVSNGSSNDPILHNIEVSFYGATTDSTGSVVPDNDPLGLTPVPEPASLLLLGTGLVGVVRTARRRMRK